MSCLKLKLVKTAVYSGIFKLPICNSSQINVLKLLLLVSIIVLFFVSFSGPQVIQSDAVPHYTKALPELWMERLLSCLWPAFCSHSHMTAVAHSLLGAKGVRQAFTPLYVQKRTDTIYNDISFV